MAIMSKHKKSNDTDKADAAMYRVIRDYCTYRGMGEDHPGGVLGFVSRQLVRFDALRSAVTCWARANDVENPEMFADSLIDHRCECHEWYKGHDVDDKAKGGDQCLT